MNFKTIQRIDESVAEVIMMVHKVVVYQYSEASKTWERSSIEGTLFVYSRSTPPFYTLLILNQLSNDNLFVYLDEKILIHTQTPFVLVRTGYQDLVYGLNFHDQVTCQKLGSLLDSLCQKNSHTRKYSKEQYTASGSHLKSKKGISNDSMGKKQSNDSENSKESSRMSLQSKSPLTKDSVLLQPSIFMSPTQVNSSSKTTSFPSIPSLVHSPGMKTVPAASDKTEDSLVHETASVSISIPTIQVNSANSSISESTTHTENCLCTGLTKSQIQQALLYMIKNDDSFIDRLHSAYVESLKESSERI